MKPDSPHPPPHELRIFQYPPPVSMPTAWTQWSMLFPQLERMPPEYEFHLLASTQTERGPARVGG